MSGADGVNAAAAEVSSSSVDSVTDASIDRPEVSPTGIKKPDWMSGGDDDGSSTGSSTDSKAASSGSKEDGDDKSKEDDSLDDGKEGVDDKAKEEGTDDGKTDGKEKDTDSADQDDDESDSGDDSGDDEDQDLDDGKPPKGFVPLQALKEQKNIAKFRKQENLDLQAENAELKTQLATMKTMVQKEETPAEFADFEGKTDEEIQDELDILYYEDAKEGRDFAKKWADYKEHLVKSTLTKAEKEAEAEALADARLLARGEIREALQDDETKAAITEFAIANGFDKSAFFLTNPDQQIFSPDKDGNMRLVSPGYAASIVKLLANAHKLSTQKPEITLEDIPDDIREKIAEQVKKELVEEVKGKKATETKTEKSVSDLKSADGSTVDTLSGKSYASMTPEERKRSLGGA